MKLYLAGEHEVKNGNKCLSWNDINILESYYYARKNPYVPTLISSAKNFLLDSGAFTFMQNTHVRTDWDAYVEEYAAFIRKYNVQLFFELDIDSVVGLKEVERLRAKLETITGKKCIPVWHTNRGTDYFLKMCQEYQYVSIGGLVKKNGGTADVPDRYFPWFINTAHAHGVKIHGLGYTKIGGLKQYHFDSVDSTAWTYGNRGGVSYEV